QRDNLQQQECDLHPFLAKASEVEAALEQLHQAKQRLGVLDRTQTQIAPLLQRQHALQRELDRTQSRYAARLEELNATAQRLQRGATEKHPLQEGLRQVEAALAELEKTRTYLQRVKEKGLERRNFLDSLKVRQQTYEHQLKEVDRKLELLQSSNAPEGAAPACPLCDRPLDNHHQQRVCKKPRHNARNSRISSG
ncbi:MAG: ATP-binding cassette family protein, partial [Coleofasciculaceae cyanobacterium SM2_3_26]|nr:ATP-binding cassette family protein [Coleofasciculaceae cyanobacterium SM2_3_26]